MGCRTYSLSHTVPRYVLPILAVSLNHFTPTLHYRNNDRLSLRITHFPFMQHYKSMDYNISFKHKYFRVKSFIKHFCLSCYITDIVMMANTKPLEK